jgi:branched-chain amino acid transport system permease protein
MNTRYASLILTAGLLAGMPFVTPPYFMHLLIQILLWGFIYTAWSIMGRFSLVSLGHGAFLGLGAYVPALLWNLYSITPWLGISLSVVLAVLLSVVIGYPCVRLRVVGHYFALVTLALGQVVMLSIVAARDVTGGSLGLTINSVGRSWYAFQFPDKTHFYLIALAVWISGLAVWHAIDRGISREALDAISEDEEAAAAIGIDVMREKLRVTVVSAALTALGGGIYAQYMMYINPETLSGIGVSLQIVFGPIVGGMYTLLGATVGALLTISLNEGLRVGFGTSFICAANKIYGILHILCIIFMPRGIVGTLERLSRGGSSSKAAPARPGGDSGSTSRSMRSTRAHRRQQF